MSDSTSSRPFITTSEIVVLTKVHPNTVALWRTTKKIIPRDKIGNVFLYDKNEVMDFLSRRSLIKKEQEENRERLKIQKGVL